MVAEEWAASGANTLPTVGATNVTNPTGFARIGGTSVNGGPTASVSWLTSLPARSVSVAPPEAPVVIGIFAVRLPAGMTTVLVTVADASLLLEIVTVVSAG